MDRLENHPQQRLEPMLQATRGSDQARVVKGSPPIKSGAGVSPIVRGNLQYLSDGFYPVNTPGYPVIVSTERIEPSLCQSS